ncbi:peptidoglycan-binding domain-containing protein [Rubrobacter calidifluminis]|uniref:peptidoglycan-binding domain-containing protein n=1 Tax=Rubrobacter calidifluminis TaxID=1392640 RepID=UPI0023624B35|nr:peptidoglycan-binding protein [Rubrobacter calidifluminis]
MRRLLVLASLAALAVLLAAVPAQARMRPQVGCAPTGCWPVYSYGDQDTDVYAIQYFLRDRGFASFTPTGYYGALTTQAVERFQKAGSIPVSGVVGAKTWPELVVPVRYGQTNDAVRALQTELQQQYGYNIPVTGYYGNITRSDVMNFQKTHGLRVTGSANRATWHVLISAR